MTFFIHSQRTRTSCFSKEALFCSVIRNTHYLIIASTSFSPEIFFKPVTLLVVSGQLGGKLKCFLKETQTLTKSGKQRCTRFNIFPRILFQVGFFVTDSIILVDCKWNWKKNYNPWNALLLFPKQLAEQQLILKE